MTHPYRPAPPENIKPRSFSPLRPLRKLFVIFLLFSWWISMLPIKIDWSMNSAGPIPFLLIWGLLFGIACVPATLIGWWVLCPAIGQFVVYSYINVSFHLSDKECRESWQFWATK